MRSPDGGHELRRLEGEASDLWGRGDRLMDLGTTMDHTAAELHAIGDSSIHISKGTTKLAELATETAVDMEKAATRYYDTGLVVRAYGTALDIAQVWIHPRIEEIEEAENNYQAAKDAKEDADGDVSGLDRTFPWEDEPTAADRTKASDAAGAASADLTSAKVIRDELWESFDSTFGTWSDAYDEAVNGIQKAMDSADNNDGFWEFVDDALAVLTVVLIVLSVVALIIGAPLFGALGLLILGLTVLVVALTALKYFAGKATLGEMLWSLAGLLPFGAGKLLKLGPALGAVVKGGRGVVATAIRSGLPRVGLLRPSTWGTPIKWVFAGRTARLALPRPGLLVNPFKSVIGGGPNAIQVQKFVTTMQNTKNPALADFIASTAAQAPTRFARGTNAGLWLTSNFLTGDGLGDYLPKGALYDVVPVGR